MKMALNRPAPWRSRFSAAYSGESYQAFAAPKVGNSISTGSAPSTLPPVLDVAADREVAARVGVDRLECLRRVVGEGVGIGDLDIVDRRRPGPCSCLGATNSVAARGATAGRGAGDARGGPRRRRQRLEF